jgi:hypothetical protein
LVCGTSRAGERALGGCRGSGADRLRGLGRWRDTRSAKPLNPVSTKSQEGQFCVSHSGVYRASSPDRRGAAPLTLEPVQARRFGRRHELMLTPIIVLGATMTRRIVSQPLPGTARSPRSTSFTDGLSMKASSRRAPSRIAIYGGDCRLAGAPRLSRAIKRMDSVARCA